MGNSRSKFSDVIFKADKAAVADTCSTTFPASGLAL